jgi:hypothetical protein
MIAVRGFCSTADSILTAFGDQPPGAWQTDPDAAGTKHNLNL